MAVGIIRQRDRRPACMDTEATQIDPRAGRSPRRAEGDRDMARFLGRIPLAAALIAALSGFTALEALFAPKAELWPRWQARDESSEITPDHGPWSRFLKAYVVAGADGVNRVAYDRVLPADRRALDDYLAGLALSDVDALAGASQIAYWINLYNALTVRLILDHPKVASIRDIKLLGGFFSSGPWNHPLVEVKGERMSLNDIEHRILRPIWRDPRVHYAVNCAAIGCPNLGREAYTGGNIERRLDAAARAYVNHRRGLARRPDGGLTASKIYAWFGDDFGGEAGVIEHLRRYADEQTRTLLEGGAGIDAYDYDWTLNAAPAPAG